jgi:hypothetical protein
VWALVPWANAGINLLLDTESRSAVWEQSGRVVILNYAALSFAIVIAIWGTERSKRCYGPRLPIPAGWKLPNALG